MPKINVSRLLRRVLKAEGGKVQVDAAEASEFFAKLCLELCTYNFADVEDMICAAAARERKRQAKLHKEAKS